MKIPNAVRLGLAAIAAAATIAAGAGTAHAADELWFYVGDYPGTGSPLDVMCVMTDQIVQCFPNQPTYPVPGNPPSCAPYAPAATLNRSGPATFGYVCRSPIGSPNAQNWDYGASARIGPFFCARYGTSDAPDVFCRRDADGVNFQIARTWYRV